MKLDLCDKGANMNYKDIFSVNTIIPNLEASNKYEVIDALVTILKEKKKISDKEQILSEVISRELSESTGLENGLAIPHARTKEINKIITAIARIPQGVDFVSQDRNLTHIAILICYPPGQDSAYLHLISEISQVLRNKENLNLLVKSKTSKEIYSNLIDLLEKNDSRITKTSKKTSSKEDETITDISPTTEKPQEIYLLIRLQFYEEQYNSSPRKKKYYMEKIKNTRSLITPRILDHYDRLKKNKYPPVVPIEGNICKGCNTAVPNEFLNHLIQNRDKINYCPNCRRFVYLP